MQTANDEHGLIHHEHFSVASRPTQLFIEQLVTKTSGKKQSSVEQPDSDDHFEHILGSPSDTRYVNYIVLFFSFFFFLNLPEVVVQSAQQKKLCKVCVPSFLSLGS